MIRYLLDTSACLALIRGRAPRMRARLRRCRRGSVALSSVTLGELYAAVARSSDPARNMAALAQFCAPLRILSFDEAAAGVYGPLGEEDRLGTADALIAAQALASNLALVTDRERVFRRVRGLDVRCWT